MLSKREKLFAAVSDLHGLICPVCRQLLSRQGDNLICAGGHAINVNRRGCVNLLSAQADTFYDAALFAARERVFTAGCYQPVADAIDALLPDAPQKLLDAGCGEGWYLNALLTRRTDSIGAGIDISKPDGHMVVDIGGASTELIIGCGFIAKECESFHVGCVNTSRAYFPDGKITANALKQAQLSAQAEFEEAHQEFTFRNWDAAYGSAGTIGAVADIGHASGLTNGVVTPALLKVMRKELVEAGDIRKINFPGLKEDRREVIAGGLAVLSAVFDTFKIKEMRPASGALRVGLLYDMLGRQEQRDTRDSTVTALIKRSSIDKQQAARVAALADKFFVALNPDDQQMHDCRKLLQWASMLHETGRVISPSGYHKHSQYILMNSDLPGFSRYDQTQMSTLVLGQRGNLKKVESALQDPTFVNMLLSLRLAVIFAHARRTLRLPEIKLERVAHTRKTAFRLWVDPQWLSRHPLTGYLLEQESLVWARVGMEFTLQNNVS